MDKYTVRDESGVVDVVASAEKYAEALAAWTAENELSTEALDTAVNAVFDRYRGQNLHMPALLSMCAVEMGGDPSAFKQVTKRLHAHIRGMAASGVLSITKGVGGGVCRVADKPAKEEPAAQ